MTNRSRLPSQQRANFVSKLRAGRTFDFAYEGDTFQLKVMSGEDVDRYSELVEHFKQSTDQATRKTIMQELIELTVAKWPWEGTLRSVANDGDCWQLIGAAMRGAHLSEDERKKLGSQPVSETG